VIKIDSLIGDLESAMSKLAILMEDLKQLRDESQAVEKARDALRRRRPKKE
jgi:hypothetical protein